MLRLQQEERNLKMSQSKCQEIVECFQPLFVFWILDMSIILFYKVNLISFINLQLKEGIQLYGTKLNSTGTFERNISQLEFYGDKLGHKILIWDNENYREYIHHCWSWYYHRRSRGERNSSYDLYLKAIKMALIFIAKIDQDKLRTTNFFSSVFC